MRPALVAMGSNIPPRREHLQSALAALADLPRTQLLGASSWRETAPVDAPVGSGPFLNGACLLSTALDARVLLDRLLDIEARHGRVRRAANGPRSLDLDLVLLGDLVIEQPGLVLPHPRAHLREFVLQPAAEVAPDLVHPRLGLSLAALWEAWRARELEAS